MILKADPKDAVALRDRHAGITPGYHINKRHWITVAAGNTVDETLVRQLVDEPYRLVVSGLRRSERPRGIME